MKILYYDCFAGISGDMNLGAMIDLGVSPEHITQELAKLNLTDEYSLKFNKKEKMGITGTKVDVIITAEAHDHHHDHGHVHEAHDHHHDHDHVHEAHDHHHDHDHAHEAHDHHHSHDHAHEAHNHHHDHDHVHEAHDHHHDHDHVHEAHDHHHDHANLRNYIDIITIINNSTLSNSVKKDSCEMFKLLAIAEGKVHGKPIEEVHFHEVGAIDSIVDIVGAAICKEALGIDKIISAPIETGNGFVRCAHGLMPIPAPATAELLSGIPMRSNVDKFEMTTPTGAVILKYYASEFIEKREFTILKTGYGLGTREMKQLPNVLRVFIAEQLEEATKQWMIEANIDDMSSEMLVYAEERLFAAGALDVYVTPIVMKKGRPASRLSILSRDEDREKLEEILFRETTTIGLRRFPVEKRVLKRTFEDIETPYGKITVKRAFYQGACVNVKPEYEQCRAIALEAGISIQALYQEIAPYIKL